MNSKLEQLKQPEKLSYSLAVIASVAICSLLFMLHLSLGAKPLSYAVLYQSLSSFDNTNFNHMIIHNIRLPRALVAMAVGASLSVAGAIMQGVTRNPLASPSVLGLLAGASFAVVIGLGLFDITSPLYTPWIAALGAATAAILVLAIATAAPGGATTLNLTLSGAAISALLAALISVMQLANEDDFDDLREWLTGSLSGSSLQSFYYIAPIVLLALTVAVLLSRKITVLGMGDEIAKGLGVKTFGLKVQLLLIVIVLTACSVALAGPVGFVGLVIPHVIRFFVGADYRWVIPFCAIIGAAFLLSVDIVARTVISPQEISTGIITAIIGAPLFVYLVKMKLR
ncbi:MAG: hypothetical protein OFPI_03860 [Osedax symbiont Rs2]|nr:MAG: hypothetical protein OFPI_03860 [Osedax symbiont Rs2]